ncbi:hypothetical protein GGF46_000612 [Coemansia sp. RSA 552]|nr:hypothetical protein GGF46_000612 [Coemansia sp. RSA 552]
MLGIRTESVTYRRSKRQGMAMSVTERYLRTDIPCALRGCSRCAMNADLAQAGVPLLDDAAPLVLPDAGVVSRFIELLEQAGELKNLVFCQTIVDALDRHNRTRTIRNVRRIAKDPSRSSAVFANEVFADTRLHGSDVVGRDVRAVMSVAAWYSAHLMAMNRPVRIVLLTLKGSQDELGTVAGGRLPEGVELWQLGKYLAEFHPGLVDHFRAIEQPTADGDMDITAMSPAEYARARLQAKAQGSHRAYLSDADIDEGVRAGTLVRGKIRLLPANATRAETQGVIERDGDVPDIVVTGRAALNRVCTGDVVVVKLLTGSTEQALESKDAKTGDGDNVEGEDATEDIAEAQAAEQIDVGEETPVGAASAPPVPGEVVGVVERKWRPYVATLQVDEAGGMRHLAVPVDASVPKIRIHYLDVAAIKDRYFVVAVDGWPADSQYPQGHFIRALGPIGALDAEIDTILVERQIAVSQSALAFSEASMREMPADSPEHPWTPRAEDIRSRRDLRDMLIFSIDPKGSQDIDDAVSMRRTDGGYELGVHIADVTQFVAAGSATDTEAMSRGTTVYLADRRFNMIPEVLSEQVCSLRGGRDRFAVSVLWDLDHDYNTRNIWFGRTVIRSACEMYYEQAQAFLDGKGAGLDPKLEKQLCTSTVELAKAMRVLRERRRQRGALELASTEIKFSFDPATHAVSEVIPKSSLEIHRVIEEAMVFANSAVACRIHQAFPQAALLRRHRSPTSERFERLVRAAQTKGFDIDCSSNAALATSLRKVTEAATSKDPDLVFLAKSMATLAMQEADYFATGDCSKEEFAHYGLAVDYYTHFTSPIRRYADIVVHRQLLDALAGDYESMAVSSRSWVGQTATRLNERNRQSKVAQRESTELFQSRYVSQQTREGKQCLVADGVVAEVRTNGLIVYVPRLGIRGPVHLRDKSGNVKLPLSSLSGNTRDIDTYVDGCTEFTAEASRLTIGLPINVPAFHLGSPTLRFAVFDHVKVALRVLETRRRRPPVYLTLVSRGVANVKDVKAYRSTLTSLDRQFRVSAATPKSPGPAKEAAGDGTATAVKAKEDAPGGKKHKKRIDYYSVLQKFSEMSLLETSCDSQCLD